jgi:[ribosomal protein S18]-alanine N-acetyltransferase
MSLPDGLHLRVARPDDLPRVAELRESVGWASHDWALRAVLDGPHARCFVATDGADRMVGVGSGIDYGSFGVVGNMVVVPEHRRRGIGAAVLEAVLAFLDERGCTRLELSATDLGRPLYASYGFATAGEGTSAVVGRSAMQTEHAAVDLADAEPAALGELAAFDAPRFGGDRTSLLATMLADPARPVVIAREGGATVGWGWIRPEANRIGPLVADTPAVAIALVADAMRRMPEAATMRLTMPPGNRAGVDRLRLLGAELESWDGRMSRGPAVQRREETLYASSVGALG